MPFSCRLTNTGEGRALNISVGYDLSHLPIDIRLIEPKNNFEMLFDTEQIVVFGITLRSECDKVRVPIQWKCRTLSGRQHSDSDLLIIEQQRVQPDWTSLLADPPYKLNPLKKRADLYGRDTMLDRLILNASSGTSTFLWGQKRVGKTSILQVLASELSKRADYICVFLRMGEISSLHEGQIANRIAERLCNQLPDNSFIAPDEQHFGAGLGSLVPFFEKISVSFSEKKFIVIVDEFDDLNPAFYTGQRGKSFVKALRSLSEIGMTFFFVGSERMDRIYQAHEVDLNKWVNASLDCIESKEDCKSLITQPVINAMEYQEECVDSIVDYCDRNPFYMHLMCYELFTRCHLEKRTYIGESDLQNVQQSLIKNLGQTNFSHFWDDNPEIDEFEKTKQSSENCLVLCCITALVGSSESIDDLFSAQDTLSLGISERMSAREMRTAVERLKRRNVMISGEKLRIRLPIFRDWLLTHAQLLLLHKWQDFCIKRTSIEEPAHADHQITITGGPFPIPEDELLFVSQNLFYLGRQKDVTEIRVWLRQFDDDVRIEIAFFLLKRLAEKGFVTEGSKLNSLQTVEEELQARRLKSGGKAWKIIRGKKENLCITYVDSDMKSGGTIAREFAKKMRPGKQGAHSEIIDWVKSHGHEDSFIVIIDDFSGTGSTISKGLKRLFNTAASQGATDNLKNLMKNQRLLCYVLFAFPEALDKLNREHAGIQFISPNPLTVELRALDPEAGIFESEGERKFAEEILIQIGHELLPQAPLGFGDLGALLCFHNTVPNNTLPIFWSNGTVNGKPWRPLFPRA